jgi:hypothetical protein
MQPNLSQKILENRTCNSPSVVPVVQKERDQNLGWCRFFCKFNMRKHYRIPNVLGKIAKVPASIPGSATSSLLLITCFLLHFLLLRESAL